jgi:hypothetical protein
MRLSGIALPSVRHQTTNLSNVRETSQADALRADMMSKDPDGKDRTHRKEKGENMKFWLLRPKGFDYTYTDSSSCWGCVVRHRITKPLLHSRPLANCR